MSFLDALESFARLLDFFDKEVRERKVQLDKDIETIWNQYFKSDSPSFEREIDSLLVNVLEFNLKTITLLYENKLEPPTREPGEDFQSRKRAYQVQMNKAQSRLRKLQDRIFALKQKLGLDEQLYDDHLERLTPQSEKTERIEIKVTRPEAEAMQLDESVEKPEPEPLRQPEDSPEESVDLDIEQDQETDSESEEEEERLDLDQAMEIEEVEEKEQEEDIFPVETPEEPSPGASLDIEEVEDSDKDEAAQEEWLTDSEQISVAEEEIGSSGLEEAEQETEDEKEPEAEASELVISDLPTPLEDDLRRGDLQAEEELQLDELTAEEEDDSADQLSSDEDRKAIEEADAILSGLGIDADEDEAEEADEEEHEIIIEEVTRETQQSGTAEAADEEQPEEPGREEPKAVEEEESGGSDEMEQPDERPISVRIAEMQEKLAPYKKIHSERGDLKIKTRTGEWTLSLPYYEMTGKDGSKTKLLDVENFIGLHNLALKGVEEVRQNLSDISNAKEVNSMLSKLQRYFQNLYENIHEIIGSSGDSIFPEIGGEFDPDSFLMVETNLNLDQWLSIDDLYSFKELFDQAIADPFRSFVGEPENRLRYFESIAARGNPG